MDENIIKLIKDKPLSVPRILIQNYRKLFITDTELIIIILLLQQDDKVVYNPEELASEINGDKHDIMKIVNSLITKNIVSLEIEKVNKKACEYLSLDILYDKLFKLVIERENDEEEIDVSIFDTFERELGRTLSPMEYEQIKEWINSGNSSELITCALREAVLNGVNNFRYIDTILNDWKKKGYKNKKQVQKDRENYHEKKKKVEVYDTDWLNDK